MSQVFLTPVTRSTLTTDICHKLATHLIRGDWKEGDRIPAERELCQQLGVGRASLREALKALEIMGMIETRLGDGTYVCRRSDFLSRPLLLAITTSSPAEAYELVHARKVIEVELAGLAAEHATPEDLKALGKYIDTMESAVDTVQFMEGDLNFHIRIAQAAKNRILENALLLIRNLMREYIARTLKAEGIQQVALEQHKAIFLAIAKKDPASARTEMATHLDTTWAKFLAISEQSA